MPFPHNRSYATKVVGESHYESNLRELCGQAEATMRQFATTAILTLENNNPYDRNAVRVDISGLTVGHLSRADAIIFRRRCGSPNRAQFECDAVIVSLHGEAVCDYGVRLELPDLLRPIAL